MFGFFNKNKKAPYKNHDNVLDLGKIDTDLNTLGKPVVDSIEEGYLTDDEYDYTSHDGEYGLDETPILGEYLDDIPYMLEEGAEAATDVIDEEVDSTPAQAYSRSVAPHNVEEEAQGKAVYIASFHKHADPQEVSYHFSDESDIRAIDKSNVTEGSFILDEVVSYVSSAHNDDKPPLIVVFGVESAKNKIAQHFGDDSSELKEIDSMIAQSSSRAIEHGISLIFSEM